LSEDYRSKLFDFKRGHDRYDGKEIGYLFSLMDPKALKLDAFGQAQKLQFDTPPTLSFEKVFPVSASQLLEYITNYSYRHFWAQGVDKLEYNELEVTKMGTEHVCVVNGKHLNFTTVTKEGQAGQLIYGELTTSPTPVDELYQFFIVSPLSQNSCKLEVEMYLKAKSLFKKLMIALFVKRLFRKVIPENLDALYRFVTTR